MKKFVMRVEIPYTRSEGAKTDPDILVLVLGVHPETALKLHLYELLAVDVLSDKVCALPIVCKPHRSKAVVS